jgi:hypothetical protein
VKDIIYHELWLQNPTILIALTSLRELRQREVRLHYGSAVGNETLGRPQWLLTNKFILETGLKQLRTHMLVSWSDDWTLVPHTANDAAALPKAWPLIDALSATRSRINISARCATMGSVVYPGHTAKHATKTLLAKLNPIMKVLELRMQLVFPICNANLNLAEWVVRLPSFDTDVFQHLETLVVRLDLASYYVNTARYATSIGAPLRERVEELVGTLLGEKTRVIYREEVVDFESEAGLVKKCGLEYRVTRG